jgi:hypothetical protein
MTVNNLTPQEMEYLKSISGNIKTQNNRRTTDPIFVVYQCKAVCIADGTTPYSRMSEYKVDYKKTWIEYKIDDENYSHEDDIDEDLAEHNKDLETPLDKDDLETFEMGYVDDFVQAFFTEAEAQDFIDSNEYKLNHPFIYGESAYRNEEWKIIRKLLTNLEF